MTPPVNVNKIKNLLLISLLIGFCASSCGNKKEQHRYIYIKNNSRNAIYYRFSFAFPDTTLLKSDPNNYKIEAGEQTFTSAGGFAYNSTMQMFILDADLVEKDPWDSIVVHNKNLKRYQFTDQELQVWNNTIVYP